MSNRTRTRSSEDPGRARGRASRPIFCSAPHDAERWVAPWAYEDRLVDLEGVLGPVLDLFDADAIEVSTLLDGKTGRRGLYALPMGRYSNHVHVWNSLLERAGFTLADIPKQWEAFWSFWCDQVQPAVRKAMGRDDIWGVGLPMSAAAIDTDDELLQFQLAYGTPWLDRDRRLQVDDPAVRAGIIRALDGLHGDLAQGLHAARLGELDQHRQQQGIPRADRGDDGEHDALDPGRAAHRAARRLLQERRHHRLAGRCQRPAARHRRCHPRAVVFKAGSNPALAEDFVRFLAEEGWLAHWLDFAGDRFMPPMRKLVEQPFWLDPSDPHRMRAAIQILTRPHLMNMDVRDHEWRSGPIWDENVWGKAVHRVVAEGISPEQAVDEAIARIKQILSE